MRFLALRREAHGKCFGYLLTGAKDFGGGRELAPLPHFAGQMDKLASGRNKKSDPNCAIWKGKELKGPGGWSVCIWRNPEDTGQTHGGKKKDQSNPKSNSLVCTRPQGQPQSEVEDWYIKEVTDAFAFIQVVDVVMVSGGRREAEQRSKHF